MLKKLFVTAVVIGLLGLVVLGIDNFVLFNVHKTLFDTSYYGREYNWGIKSKRHLFDAINNGWTIDGIDGIYVDNVRGISFED